jgi:hypothetical protein
MKEVWNGGGQYFSLAQSPEIRIVGSKNGFNVYARKDEPTPEVDVDLPTLF